MRLIHIFIILAVLWGASHVLDAKAAGRTDINEMVSQKADVQQIEKGLVIDMSCTDLEREVFCYVQYFVTRSGCPISTEIFASSDKIGNNISDAIVQSSDEYYKGCTK